MPLGPEKVTGLAYVALSGIGKLADLVIKLMSFERLQIGIQIVRS